MNCREAAERILAAEPDDSAELREHLSSCSDCCELRKSTEMLERLGETAKAQDMSREGISATRDTVSELLAARQRDGIRGVPAFRRWRFVTAWALTTLLLASAGVLFSLRGIHRTDAPDSTVAQTVVPDGDAALDLDGLDAEIDALGNSLEYAIERSGSPRRYHRRTTSFMRRARVLRQRIDAFTDELQEDLDRDNSSSERRDRNGARMAPSETALRNLA